MGYNLILGVITIAFDKLVQVFFYIQFFTDFIIK